MLFVQFHRELNIFWIFFNISPILAEQKNGNIGRVKSHLGTPRGFISSTPSERARFLLQITAIKFLGYVKYKILERQTKVGGGGGGQSRSNQSAYGKTFLLADLKRRKPETNR